MIYLHKVLFFLFFSSGIILFLNTCGEKSLYPDEPEITFIGISKDTLAQSFLNVDSILIQIGYQDGDGDLGSKSVPNFFIEDSRDGSVLQSKMDEFPVHGSKGIRGTITFTNYSTCCIFEDNTPPCTPSTTYPTDQLTYRIWIVDRAGNKSNVIETPPIYIDCTK